MKLEFVKKYELENVDFLESCIVINQETAVALTIDKDRKYNLLMVSESGIKSITLNYLETFTKVENNPVLFGINGQFGIIKNAEELCFYQNIESEPVIVPIKNKKLFGQVLPSKIRLQYTNPISDSDILPVCFEKDTFDGSPRYWGLLNFDSKQKQAKWESWMQLDNTEFPFHTEQKRKYPPKLDSVMIKENKIYVYTSGGSITSVNKWGMDYYALVRTTEKGNVTETIYGSGNLHTDEKKRGVNGIFTSSLKYVILTPVFQSDEWKGKQKLFSLETKELKDIALPRGVDKYVQVIQHGGELFWLYKRDKDNKQILICKEKID